MAQKVDHSALWMYAPNADGVGVPRYFKPTERDGATVGKHPGPWLAGGGLTNMLLTPHEGEGGGVDPGPEPPEDRYTYISTIHGADDIPGSLRVPSEAPYALGGWTISTTVSLLVTFENQTPQPATAVVDIPGSPYSASAFQNNNQYPWMTATIYPPATYLEQVIAPWSEATIPIGVADLYVEVGERASLPTIPAMGHAVVFLSPVVAYFVPRPLLDFEDYGGGDAFRVSIDGRV